MTREMCPCGMPQSKPLPHDHYATKEQVAYVVGFAAGFNSLADANDRILFGRNPKQSKPLKWQTVLKIFDEKDRERMNKQLELLKGK